MKEIVTKPIRNCSVVVPGSKSYTHRILIASALSDGICRIDNPLKSEDTLLTASGLKQLGVKIEDFQDYMMVYGSGGVLRACADPIYLGNSGTSVRLLTGICALGKGKYVLTGTQRMKERPIQNLLDGLVQLGVHAKSSDGNGCPPVEIEGGPIKGGAVGLDCHISSQYLSSLLLMAPYVGDSLDITVSKGPVSKPYVDLTIEVMQKMGISIERNGYDTFLIPGGQIYKAGSYRVESDCSQAGYFWAAAAITGASIKVIGISTKSKQGDVGFTQVLESMGCCIEEDSEGIRVTGGSLKGIDVDMSDMPDMVPTLAVVAAFAEGTTNIINVAHLKAKESDRLGSVVTELTKMGIQASCTDDGMTIIGGTPKGSDIHTYEDHRIAMSFAVSGLKVPGLIIKDEMCIKKSFPNFWEVFESLYVV
jgi:3-phosphoshikimate 1-carboxyvinyltransferase